MGSKFKLTGLAAAMAVALSGCGGGGNSDSTTEMTGGTTDVANAVAGSLNSDNEIVSALTRGFSLPSEISAVPAEEDTTTRSFSRSLRSLTRAPSDLPSTSDYSEARANRYVEERALEQFGIIEEVLVALAQTNYAAPEVINLGPYTAMVSWTENENGRDTKTLESWVVDSRMIVIDGEDVNRVLIWIEEPDYENPGQMRVTKAEFLIYEAGNKNVDGSFADYGSWDMNVTFGDTGVDFFVASSRVINGETTLKINESISRMEMGTPVTMTFSKKGILVRGANVGYGKVSYSDEEACYSGIVDCSSGVPSKLASYAYNADYLAVQENNEITYKDRNPANAVEMTHRYGLFYNESPVDSSVAAGDNVEKHLNFGFPLRVPMTNQNGSVMTDPQGNEIMEFAYYGSWQGRHEIWGGQEGQGIPAGTTVYRGDYNDSSSLPEVYTTAAPIKGTFTKRLLADASLDDIRGIAVETHTNSNFSLSYMGGNWRSCEDGWIDRWADPANPQCIDHLTQTAKPLENFSAFDMLVANDRIWINVNGDPNPMDQDYSWYDYLYLAGADAPGGDGFYLAEWDMDGLVRVDTATAPEVFSEGAELNINISGSIYIQYTGDFTSGNTGWVQKTLLSFDEQIWQPEFDTTPSADVTFSPEVGYEYYINNNGANFIVRRTDPADALTSYDVKSELQKSANPSTAATFLPAIGIDYFRTPWDTNIQLVFDADPASSSYMMLVYAADDPMTSGDDTGAVYMEDQWGLQGYQFAGDANDPSDDLPVIIYGDDTVATAIVDEWGFPVQGEDRPAEFNWEYMSDGEYWGAQQYLKDSNDAYVILEDPIVLNPITIAHGTGTKTLSLQFDGWFYGLPDMYADLAMNNWEMTAAIAEKVVSIPASTAATSGDNEYYIKPLDISVFLDVVSTADITAAGGVVPDVTDGNSVDLTTVPDLVDHQMGIIPQDTDVLYSEGLPVE